MKIETLFKEDENITLESYLNKCGVKDIQEYIIPSGRYLDDYHIYKGIDDAIKEIKYLMNFDDGVIDIVVDADVDGFCSACIIYQYLSNLNTEWTIHMLVHEGKIRGLEDEDIMNQIIEHNPNLVIIPDAGSNDKIQAQELCEKGIGLVVLDHHALSTPIEYGTLINNQMLDEGNKDGSGTLVAHKFLQALDNEFKLHWSNNVIDLVALSLVSDSCDMSAQENRCYYYYGLQDINLINNNFLYNLILRFINSDTYTQRDIAFKIVPKINSVIRSGDQELKQRVLCALIGYEENIDEVLDLCEQAHLNQIKTVDGIVRKLSKEVEKNHENNIIIVTSKEMPKTYSGLVAGKLMNMTQKPTILGKVKDGLFIGSLRSPIDIQEDLDNNEFVDWAHGHGMACGIQIQEENIPKLIEYYNALETLPEPQINVLASYQMEFIPDDLFGLNEAGNKLWGHGVDAPKFHISLEYNPSDIYILGKNGLTCKMTQYGVDIMFFTCSKEKKVQLGMGFINDANKFEPQPKDEKFKLDIIGQLEYNRYGDKVTPTIIVDRFEVSKAKKKLTAKDVFR